MYLGLELKNLVEAFQNKDLAEVLRVLADRVNHLNELRNKAQKDIKFLEDQNKELMLKLGKLSNIDFMAQLIRELRDHLTQLEDEHSLTDYEYAVAREEGPSSAVKLLRKRKEGMTLRNAKEIVYEALNLEMSESPSEDLHPVEAAQPQQPNTVHKMFASTETVPATENVSGCSAPKTTDDRIQQALSIINGAAV